MAYEYSLFEGIIASIRIPTATDLFGGVYIFRNKESKPNLKIMGWIWIIKLKLGQEMGQWTLTLAT